MIEKIVDWIQYTFIRPCRNCGRSTLGTVHYPEPVSGICWIEWARDSWNPR